jgi:hypothetical protein
MPEVAKLALSDRFGHFSSNIALTVEILGLIKSY